MPKTLTLLDSVALIGLFIYNGAMFLGVLRFGREMGDMGYYGILTLGTILLLIFYFLKFRRIWKKHTEVITVLALLLLTFIFYYSSFGRGPDYPWNGQFFG
tara:strand:+ start:712 stop:1014 length:303 start_codon:yes stop_codon:yes gene_type:complete